MSEGLMCDCPLPPMTGLTPTDRGHTPRDPARHGGKPGCAQYAEDQQRGGLCRFCAEAHILAARLREVPNGR